MSRFRTSGEVDNSLEHFLASTCSQVTFSNCDGGIVGLNLCSASPARQICGQQFVNCFYFGMIEA